MKVNERVKEIGSINLDGLQNIKKNIIEEFNRDEQKYIAGTSYSLEGYTKACIFDRINPFIFNDEASRLRCHFPSNRVEYDKFVLTEDDQLEFAAFLGLLGNKLNDYFSHEVIYRVEFAQLEPNRKMHWHTDLGAHLKHRINLVFENDVKSGFQSEENLFRLQKGKMYLCDVARPHRAVNFSNQTRHGLVIEVISNFPALLEYKHMVLQKLNAEALKKSQKSPL